MWAQDNGQGAQLCLTSPVGQLVLAHESLGQGSGVKIGRREVMVIFSPVFILHSYVFLDVKNQFDSSTQAKL